MVFVLLADEPRKFIYGKRGADSVAVSYTHVGYAGLGAGYCFFPYHGFPRAYQRRLSD
mgnify:CR=1 FL=1